MKAIIGNMRPGLALLGAAAFTLLAAAGASAAKPSSVGKVSGSASVVRASDGKWLACWSMQNDGNYKLFCINADKGDSKEVASTDDPGGLCWLLGKNQLLYTKSKSVDNSVQKYHDVTYFIYDPAKGESKKLSAVKDLLDTYRFDPISSDDGSRAFHMTIGARKIPSFNLYFTEGGQLLPRDVTANIGADYDLSSDGSTLYWSLVDPKTGGTSIVGWSFDHNTYSELYQYSPSKDPSQSSTQIRVNSPRKQAVMRAYSEKDPTLKLCVYNYADPKNLNVIPIKLSESSDVLTFDWKGRSGTLYILYQPSEKQYKLVEYDVTTGKATSLLDTSDNVTFVDYSVAQQTYYYTVVAGAKGKFSTLIMRLK